MIKNLIRRLFSSERKRNEIIKDLKSNTGFRTTEDSKKTKFDTGSNSDFTLEKGKIQSIYVPDLGNQKGLILTNWYFKQGDIVKHGDVICEIENKNISMEVETYFSGKLLSHCKLNEKLTSGTEIFKIEGI
ncbi:biotin/lipoyl-containing protein [uncultured Lacinutrix sp.]|uniref:biotin/lipoyl-containing protein n=1 Tax=uncultured Lacinutrix sp. TaxID=574032 RepID=UPI00261C5AB0|nr:biotin/lipoyl-containing protein [uncultured Lacinutrix sp.]